MSSNITYKDNSLIVRNTKNYYLEVALGVLIALLILSIFLTIKYYECYKDKKNYEEIDSLCKKIYNYNKTRTIEFSARTKIDGTPLYITDSFGTILGREIKLTMDMITYNIHIPEDVKEISFKTTNLSDIYMENIKIDGNIINSLSNNNIGIIFKIN